MIHKHGPWVEHDHAPHPCTCYVQKLPEIDRFCIRFGAHSKACLVYRESLDPVDRANDSELRDRMGKGNA